MGSGDRVNQSGFTDGRNSAEPTFRSSFGLNECIGGDALVGSRQSRRNAPERALFLIVQQIAQADNRLDLLRRKSRQ